MRCCYQGYIEDFLSLNMRDWLEIMIHNYQELCGEHPSVEQVSAWQDCFEKIYPTMEEYKDRKYYLIFEYELPHEGGRRPDLIILMDNEIVVIEFKRKNGVSRADLDQVSAYSRDLKSYHKSSHHKNVTPVLIPTLTQNKLKLFGDVHACSPDRLSQVIETINGDNIRYNPDEWVNSVYEPLPSLVRAAKKIYLKEPLPFIRRANSTGIPEALKLLKTIADKAEVNQERILALVTGVPGAGKTLLGLQFTYECFNRDNDKKSVFLSGNGPLVEVLQHALQCKVFVQPLRNYVKYYGISKRGNPKENIVVFDEAQRAWSLEQVKEKHGVNASEPDLIIKIADQIPKWCVFMGLIGEGQEIHVGEETGIVQWKDAIQSSNNEWKVVCPGKLAHLFDNIAEVIVVNELDLTVTLRSHLAEDVTLWANELLKNNINVAKELASKIEQQGFKMYITKDLDKAKGYCKNRYEKNIEKRYGLLASSKANVLPRFRVDNSYNTTKQLKVGPWYNDSPDKELSCCRLNKVATEFACQGLELDMPIVCWGDDMIWENDQWKPFEQRNARVKDPSKLRINSYRVLLTRGRDGFIIYVPDSPKLKETYNILVESGITEL